VLSAPRAVWLKDGAFVAIAALAVAVPLFLLSGSVTYFIVCIFGLGAVLALQWRHPVRVIGIAALILGTTNLYEPSQEVVFRARSFYGVYKAVDIDNGRYRVLYHGTTAHGGEQIRDQAGREDKTRPIPMTYYHLGGVYSEIIDAVRQRDGGQIPQVALVGLGMGALTCKSVPGEAWTIYELDPLIVDIARNRGLFRSLSMCAPKAGIVVGDGRLTLQRAKSNFDLIMLDMFSSDSVPVHMLTREAFALYRARLAPHGTLVVHISNAHLRLEDVVAASAAQNGMVTAVKTDGKLPPDTFAYRAQVAVVVRSMDDLKALRLGKEWRLVAPAPRPWSDDYSDIFGAMIARWRHAN
jgi:spermidine synthase